MDEYLTQYSINWKLILGDSPWWGRFYERMAQIVKMSLHKLIGKVKLCYEELETVSTHIESVINFYHYQALNFYHYGRNL